MRYFIALLVLVVSSAQSNCQNACCSLPLAAASFSELSFKQSFVAAHAEPLPYTHAGVGVMTSISVPNGAPTLVYRINSTKQTRNTVLVIHEWWGLNDYVKREADNIAAALGGNANVVAVDLYDGKVTADRTEAAAFMKGVDEKRVRAILSAVIASLGTDANIGTIGWCFGGGWSHRAALMGGANTMACVIYYGMPELNVDALRTMRAPVLGIFASEDSWVDAQVVRDFELAMGAAERPLMMRVYPAQHAFANPSNPRHDAVATQDAFDLSMEFFQMYLLR